MMMMMMMTIIVLVIVIAIPSHTAIKMMPLMTGTVHYATNREGQTNHAKN